MRSSFGVFATAAWSASLALTLLWWAPPILLALARLLGGRLRFRLVLGLGRALVAVGCPGPGAERAGRRMRAIQGRRR